MFPTSLAVHDFHLADPKRLAPDRVKTLAAQPINALPFSVGTSSNGPHPPGTSPSRLLKNWAARLTLEHEFDSCAVERAAGGIHARFGYTDR